MIKKKIWIPILVLIILFIVSISFLQSASFLRLNTQNIGHGKYSSSGLISLFKSLRILENIDYTDESGEEYCFDNMCWISAEIDYGRCIDEFDDEDLCDGLYWEILLNDCSQRCGEEIYTWDKNPVNNLGEFSETAFPDFITRSSLICNDWFIGGEWISTPDKVGCIDAGWIMCDSNSISSAGDVCDTIGYTWTCSNEAAFCD